MSIKADVKYDGVIEAGSYFSYSVNGNLALNIPLGCKDGNINFQLWLTEKNKAKAIKTLESLGADPAKLSEQSYLDNFLPGLLTGKEVSFGTKEDTYMEKTSIKVAWIGKRTDPNVARGAANFFGGSASAAKDGDINRPIDDSDIPF
jgi:hypothetical protein